MMMITSTPLIQPYLDPAVDLVEPLNGLADVRRRLLLGALLPGRVHNLDRRYPPQQLVLHHLVQGGK